MLEAPCTAGDVLSKSTEEHGSGAPSPKATPRAPSDDRICIGGAIPAEKSPAESFSSVHVRPKMMVQNWARQLRENTTAWHKVQTCFLFHLGGEDLVVLEK